jgi:hypothetical protein
MLSVLDMKSNIVFSRIPSCEFRTVDAIKDWLKDKIQTQMRIKYKMNRTNSRVEFTKRHQIARISRKLDESVNQSFVTPTCSDKKLQNRLILQARAQKMIEDIGLNLMTSKSNE